VLLILVGLGIVTGVEKYLEEKLIESGFGSTTLERDLLKKIDMRESVVEKFKNIENKEIVSELPNYGPAPELVGLQNWINSNPLKLSELRGKVVMIDFWTYSCINCIRTLPYLESWHEKYANQGLVIIGVHAPEFQFEKKLENVQKAVSERGLKYAVVQDNDFATWRAYENHYWPAKYIIDQNGDIRYYHFGEGEYEETEKVINQLLGMEGKDLVAAKIVVEKRVGGKLTAETYLGLERRERMVTAGQKLQSDQWRLDGKWKEEDERVVSEARGASHSLNFSAAKANLVIGGKATAKVMVDGKLLTENAGADVKNGVLNIDGERLYLLTDFGSNYGEHTIELVFDQPGVELYAWTFG
jgi:thiol-disulfide isomerase/thioredoxin